MNGNSQNYNYFFFIFSSNIKVKILIFGYVLAVIGIVFYIKLYGYLQVSL